LYVWDSQSATRVYTNTMAGVTNVTISADGTRLAFATATQLHVADWAANTNWLVATMSPNFRSGMRFSDDGRYLTFASKTALTSPDTNATYDVYLYDLQTRSNRLVSHRFGGTDAGTDSSDTPDISPDGRLVAYRSFATNIVAGDNNGVTDAFLYDRITDTSRLLSVSKFNGGPADSWSFPPQFTRNGHQVVFQSWASDLAGFDFNLNADAFAYALFYVNLAPGGLPASGPTLTWPIELGKTYQVEYLDNLINTNWQNASGTITNLNEWAYFTDLSPSPNQRFYRIVAN
jgi:Tol biopolymer transport system component